MSTSTLAPHKGFSLTSTNGIGNVLTFVALAVAALFGIGEDMVNAFIAAAVPLGFLIREVLEGTRKPRWAGNIATYLTSAVVLLAPWIEGLLDAASPIADAVATGNTSAIWTLLIPIVNELLLLIRNQPWKPAAA